MLIVNGVFDRKEKYVAGRKTLKFPLPSSKQHDKFDFATHFLFRFWKSIVQYTARDRRPVLKGAGSEGSEFAWNQQYSASGDDVNTFTFVDEDAFKRVIDEVMALFNQDELLLNANESLSLLLTPKNGALGWSDYDKIAKANELSLNGSLERVQYVCRIRMHVGPYTHFNSSHDDDADESAVAKEKKDRALLETQDD
jgi:hypothetical protein